MENRPKVKLGGAACQCPTCGVVFAGTRYFDAHRVGQHGVDRKCLEPELAGLKPHIREKDGVTIWGGEKIRKGRFKKLNAQEIEI